MYIILQPPASEAPKKQLDLQENIYLYVYILYNETYNIS